LNPVDLQAFVIRAKKASYVGNAPKVHPSRLDAFDLTFKEPNWAYRDSYFGGTDFLGQEVVWFKDQAVWVMNYHGTILRPDIYDGEKAAKTLRAALSQPQSQGRLLDNFDWRGTHDLFRIRSRGAIDFLRGRETINLDGIEVYALDYQAGVVRI
jgi:hypothetical protein